MNYRLTTFLSLFIVYQSVAQTPDYDSIYFRNNCVVLDAKESIQEERADLIYQWTFAEDVIVYGETVEHCFDSLGAYDVVLSVVDPQVNTLFQEEWLFQITITESYKLSFGLNKEGGKMVTASSNLLFQNAPERVDFFWDFGDGTFDIGEEVAHEYAHGGSYLVRLLAKVEDQGEIINLAQTQTIIIEENEDI